MFPAHAALFGWFSVDIDGMATKRGGLRAGYAESGHARLACLNKIVHANTDDGIPHAFVSVGGTPLDFALSIFQVCVRREQCPVLLVDVF